MISPARSHRQRMSAHLAHEAAKAGFAPLKNAKPYELMLAKLDADMRRLKGIQSIERRIDLKRQILPEYDSWVNGVIGSNSGEQDDVLMTVMVWHIDAGNIPRALELARYALEHDLKLPARYARTLPCLFAEEIAAAAKRYEPDVALLLEAERMTAEYDMPDPVRAKLKRAIERALKNKGGASSAPP
jgi:hypothetical protein